MKRVAHVVLATLAVLACEDATQPNQLRRDSGTPQLAMEVGPTLAGSDVRVPIEAVGTPRLAGPFITWWDYGNFMLYNLETGTSQVIYASDWVSSWPSFDISESFVVYQTHQSASQMSLVAYDIATGSTRPASGVDAVTPTTASISDRVVAFLDQRDGSPPFEVFVYDLDTGIETQVSPGSNHQNFSRPLVSNGYVVWEDYRASDVWPFFELGVKMFSLDEGIETTVFAQGNRCVGLGLDFVWPWVVRVECPVVNGEFFSGLYLKNVASNEVRLIAETNLAARPVIAGDYVIYSNWDPGMGNATDVELSYYHIPTGASGLVTRDNVTNYIADVDGLRLLYANINQIYANYIYSRVHWRLLTIDGIPKAASILDEVDPPQGPPPFVTLPNGMIVPPQAAGTVIDEHGVRIKSGFGN